MTRRRFTSLLECSALAGAMLWCGCSKRAVPPPSRAAESQIGLPKPEEIRPEDNQWSVTLPKFGPIVAVRRAHEYVMASPIDTAGCYIDSVKWLEKGHKSFTKVSAVGLDGPCWEIAYLPIDRLTKGGQAWIYVYSDGTVGHQFGL